MVLEKLKLVDKAIFVINQPTDYHIFNKSHASISGQHENIFIFVKTMDEFAEQVMRIINGKHLIDNGYLFIAYPKRGNKKYETYVHRDEIFSNLNVQDDGYIKDTMMKFNRMVSMDDVFTVVGLKMMKNKIKTTASSQCVDDYIPYIPQVEAFLESHPEILTFYQSLTPGYKKDWARHIFSAKQEKTRMKRLDEMKMILASGYKTKDLYKAKK